MTCADVLWMYLKVSARNFPGYNGFMFKVTEHLPYQLSKIICLPFLNYSASDYSTIYSSLSYIKQKSEENNLPCCFVTLDHPLCEKGLNILQSKLLKFVNVILTIARFLTLK